MCPNINNFWYKETPIFMVRELWDMLKQGTSLGYFHICLSHYKYITGIQFSDTQCMFIKYNDRSTNCRSQHIRQILNWLLITNDLRNNQLLIIAAYHHNKCHVICSDSKHFLTYTSHMSTNYLSAEITGTNIHHHHNMLHQKQPQRTYNCKSINEWNTWCRIDLNL